MSDNQLTTYNPINNINTSSSSNNDLVDIQTERQVLLLVLLAHVCSLQDPTPKTFTAQVLDLYERGIIDAERIKYLFDSGLVPKELFQQLKFISTNTDTTNNKNTLSITLDNNGPVNSSSDIVTREVQARMIRDHLESTSEDDPILYKNVNIIHNTPLTRELSTITNTTSSSSWSTASNPLSFSRYKRDFIHLETINSGGFGVVLKALHKIEQKEYAVKCIKFEVQGFSTEEVQTVIREVKCLAQCDHVNVVRYYASWLEPSWFASNNNTNIVEGVEDLSAVVEHRLLLNDIKHQIESRGEDEDDESSSQTFFSDNNLSARYDDDDDDDYDDESEEIYYQQDSIPGFSFDVTNSSSSIGGFHFDRAKSAKTNENDSSYNNSNSKMKHRKNHKNKSYSYQICFYIQMQLCDKTTLADWISNRNAAKDSNDSSADTLQGGAVMHRSLGEACTIFIQVVRGLAHVHSKGIIHRDLKPANIFHNGSGVYKIGDFGLSKLLETSPECSVGCAATSTNSKNRCNKTVAKGAYTLSMQTNSECLSFRNDNDDDLSSESDLDKINNNHTMGVGTASYASPEQVGSQAYSNKSDIYSLGLIFLELCSPFGTEHEKHLAFQAARQGCLPEDVKKIIPDQLCSLILRCVDQDPTKRPSATDILDKVNMSPDNHDDIIDSLLLLRQKSNSSNALQLVGQVATLHSELKEKEFMLKSQEKELMKKDARIQELERLLEQNRKYHK